MISLEAALFLGSFLGIIVITALCVVLGLVIDRFMPLATDARLRFRIVYAGGLLLSAVGAIVGNALSIMGRFTAGRIGFWIAVIGFALLLGASTYAFIHTLTNRSKGTE